MAGPFYLSSVDGDDADTGLTWALAKKTLAGAFSAMAAGEDCFVDDNHAETQASDMTLTSPGTEASPCRVICVDRTGNPEPPTATLKTASISTTGATNILITGGSCYFYGITFNNGSGATIGTDLIVRGGFLRFEQCELHLRNTDGFNDLTLGTSDISDIKEVIELINTDIRFSSSDHQIELITKLIWQGGTLLGTAPTVMVGVASPGSTGTFLARGVDLSLVTATLFDSTPSGVLNVKLLKCKLGSSVAISADTLLNRADFTAEIVNSDSADTNYRYHKTAYQGTVDQETTIVRSGGGNDGTTSLSRKLVTTANSKIYSPLKIELPPVWNETIGSSITVTVEVVTDNVTLTDVQGWLGVEYLGTSGFPLSLFADDRASDDNALLGSGTNQATSSVSWVTTGLSTPIKQKFVVSFTPQEKGGIYPTVYLAKPSTTMYADLKVEIS